VVCGVKAYELNEKYEKSCFALNLNSFLSFISYPLPREKETRVSYYLDLAKRVVEKAPTAATSEELAAKRRRKLEEASRRGLVVRWSEYPDWIALHDPLSGEWHEVRASECLPSLVEAADRGHRRK
jgi:hypothetical protein